MSKKVVSEDKLLSDMYNAITSGNSLDVENEELEQETEVAEDTTEEVTAEDNSEDNDDNQNISTEDEHKEVHSSEEAKKSWLDQLPEELKETASKELQALNQERERLQQYYRSNEGRVSGLQQKINRLEAMLSDAKKPAESVKPQPKVQEPTDMDSPVMQELKEADPILYKALKAERDATFSAFRNELSQYTEATKRELLEQFAPVQQAHREEQLVREAEEVIRVIPEVEKIIVSDNWKHFLEVAPPSVKQLANSSNSKEFIAAVDAFTVWNFRNNPQQFSSTSQNQSTVPREDTSALAATRARKLVASPNSKAQPMPRQEEVDEDKLLEDLYKKVRAQGGFSN